MAQVQSNRKSLRARWEEVTVWEVPGLNFPVKEASTIHRRDGRIDEVTRELESLVQGSGDEITPPDEPEGDESATGKGRRRRRGR